MKKIVVGLSLALLLFLCTGVFVQRNAIACELLPWLDYPRIHDQVFVEPAISSERSEELLHIIASALQRINEVYGSPDSTPRILITSNAETALSWGANETASMHRAPWRSCIIVGPKGQNVDVIAHEWLHAEIQDRVGFWRFLREIPIWFDEGAALTLDYREPFLPENIDLSVDTITAVHQLTSGRDFFAGNVRENYQAARMAVIPLIRDEHFFDDLERIANGEHFDSVFLANSLVEQPPADALVN